ncbi:hypothetical protein GOC74_15195 [Halomicrobium mukohataei]|uniref:Uncharacterized protein n=1 Tax=Halomicrobium mukohataei TaxID=57705 RepID=A0A847TZ46_9EURY|nr:hypothetical protein [Halomicrobium mukohataei]NLV11272.1 hypothetical protein [Halomicrobium mukohataei]
MSLQRPFVDAAGGLDTDAIIREAVPISALILVFVAVAIVPATLGLWLGGGLGLLFSVIAQFVLAVGAAIVLLYVIVRALQFHEEHESAATDGAAGR